jgi:hypothetical protein
MYRADAWTVTTPGFVGDYLGAQISLTLLLEDCLRDAPQHWRRDPGMGAPGGQPDCADDASLQSSDGQRTGFSMTLHDSP